MKYPIRYTFDISPELKLKFKIITSIKQKKMSNVVIKMIEDYVKKNEHVLQNVEEL